MSITRSENLKPDSKWKTEGLPDPAYSKGSIRIYDNDANFWLLCNTINQKYMYYLKDRLSLEEAYRKAVCYDWFNSIDNHFNIEQFKNDEPDFFGKIMNQKPSGVKYIVKETDDGDIHIVHSCLAVKLSGFSNFEEAVTFGSLYMDNLVASYDLSKLSELDIWPDSWPETTPIKQILTFDDNVLKSGWKNAAQAASTSDPQPDEPVIVEEERKINFREFL